MRALMIMIFMAFQMVGFSQLDISKIPTKKVRIIDRHLKTMLNMDDELIELRIKIDELKVLNSELIKKVDVKSQDVKDGYGLVDQYRVRERSLIDTVNHYKILDYGNRLQREYMKDDIEELNSSNQKKDYVIYGLTTLIGLVAGIVIF